MKADRLMDVCLCLAPGDTAAVGPMLQSVVLFVFDFGGSSWNLFSAGFSSQLYFLT